MREMRSPRWSSSGCFSLMHPPTTVTPPTLCDELSIPNFDVRRLQCSALDRSQLLRSLSAEQTEAANVVKGGLYNQGHEPIQFTGVCERCGAYSRIQRGSAAFSQSKSPSVESRLAVRDLTCHLMSFLLNLMCDI